MTKRILRVAFPFAAVAALAACGQVVKPSESGDAGSVLTATISGGDSQSEGQLAKGNYKLFCDGTTGELAQAKLENKKLAFKLAATAPAAGSLCYVNMELAAADRPQGEVSFFLTDGIYYATNKAPVVNTGSANELKLEIFKSYGAKIDQVIPGESLVNLRLELALFTAGATTATAMPGRLYVEKCEKNTELTLNGAAPVVDQGKTHVSAVIENVKKAVLGDKCSLRFLADGTRKAFKGKEIAVLAAAMGTEAAPLAFTEIIEGDVSVQVTVAGSCRKFDEKRQCVFTFPEECALPLGEAAGAYDQSKWLTCVGLAAGSTLKSLLRDGAQIQQEEGRSKASRVLQTLQQVVANFDAVKPGKDKIEFMQKRLDLARQITTDAPTGFAIKDEGVAIGVGIMTKVLEDVKKQLDKPVL